MGLDEEMQNSMAELAAPHGAFSFWPKAILIKNNFNALFVVKD